MTTTELQKIQFPPKHEEYKARSIGEVAAHLKELGFEEENPFMSGTNNLTNIPHLTIGGSNGISDTYNQDHYWAFYKKEIEEANNLIGVFKTEEELQQYYVDWFDFLPSPLDLDVILGRRVEVIDYNDSAYQFRKISKEKKPQGILVDRDEVTPEEKEKTKPMKQHIDINSLGDLTEKRRKRLQSGIKQHITASQLDELNERGKEKLRTWWEPELGDRIIYDNASGKREHSFLIDSAWRVKEHKDWGGYQLLLSIGQMIEFLGENGRVSVGQHLGEQWSVSFYPTPGVEMTGNTFADNPVDALWSAVKEILNEERPSWDTSEEKVEAGPFDRMYYGKMGKIRRS